MRDPARPPRFLGRGAGRLWHALQPKLAQAGLWRAEYALSFGVLCATSDAYFATAALANATARAEYRAELRAIARKYLEEARRTATGFYLVRPDRVHLVHLDADGLDVDLVRAFTPEAPLRVHLPRSALSTPARPPRRRETT